MISFYLGLGDCQASDAVKMTDRREQVAAHFRGQLPHTVSVEPDLDELFDSAAAGVVQLVQRRVRIALTLRPQERLDFGQVVLFAAHLNGSALREYDMWRLRRSVHRQTKVWLSESNGDTSPELFGQRHSAGPVVAVIGNPPTPDATGHAGDEAGCGQMAEQCSVSHRVISRKVSDGLVLDQHRHRVRVVPGATSLFGAPSPAVGRSPRSTGARDDGGGGAHLVVERAPVDTQFHLTPLGRRVEGAEPLLADDAE
ncbi:hypothetical protein MPTA5024_34690 [Microbispora sp. ATCC PTA-5024]|nr:hypothetical protein MPTA5024_34690 [Microbispora sp. ATCC PTA-5024]